MIPKNLQISGMFYPRSLPYQPLIPSGTVSFQELLNLLVSEFELSSKPVHFFPMMSGVIPLTPALNNKGPCQQKQIMNVLDRNLFSTLFLMEKRAETGACMATEQTAVWGTPIFLEVLQRLISAYAPERIYLFGSTGRGATQADSDIDLMIVVPDNANAVRRRSRLAYQVLRGTGTAVDVLVWTKRSFEERLHLKASLPATVIREGKLLYAS